jgi:hypothetical protein
MNGKIMVTLKPATGIMGQEIPGMDNDQKLYLYMLAIEVQRTKDEFITKAKRVDDVHEGIKKGWFGYEGLIQAASEAGIAEVKMKAAIEKMNVAKMFFGLVEPGEKDQQ